MTELSIVIPVYNAESCLKELYTRLKTQLNNTTESYEIIFVEDCGDDNSWTIIEKLAEQDNAVRGFQLCRNYGQHNAVLCGIRAAQYDVIITMDDDLQNPPEEIPKLLEKLSNGYDVVYGVPEKEQHGFWRDIASQITKLALQSTMGVETARKVSPFRAFRAKISDAFSNYRGPFVSIDVLLTWGTKRFASTPVRHDLRTKGTSNYNFRKLLIHALNMMTGFSILPLQIASIIGFFFTLFGIVILAYVVGRYFISGVTMPGFAFLASIIAIFSGAQLFAIGIIGEYLARMHFRMMDKPPYVIRTTLKS